MAQFFEVHPDNPQPRLLRQAAAILSAGGIAAIPSSCSKRSALLATGYPPESNASLSFALWAVTFLVLIWV